MFSKTTNNTQTPPVRTPSQPASAPSAAAPMASAPMRAPTRAQSIIGPDLVFEGSITGEGELLVDGAVKGDIHVSRLVIGEHAHVEGTVRGAAVEVRGRVIGNVEGKAIHLVQSAHVEGDITHEQLSIDVGAFFQGRCSQFRAQPAVQITPAPAPVEAQAISHDEAHG